MFRNRAIAQSLETYKSLIKLYEQEEGVLDNIETRMDSLGPIPTDAKKLQQMGKPVSVGF